MKTSSPHPETNTGALVDARVHYPITKHHEDNQPAPAHQGRTDQQLHTPRRDASEPQQRAQSPPPHQVRENIDEIH